MAVGVAKSWSVTAADNDDADSNIGLIEGGGTYKAPHVNNTQRAIMAAVKGAWNQLTGAKDSAGSSNAFTYTSDSVAAISTSYARGMRVSFKADHSNSGAATLDVDGVGAIAIRKGAAKTALAANDITQNGMYDFEYDGTYWILLNPEIANFQPLDATLTALAGLSTSASTYPRCTGTDAFTLDSYATVASNIGAVRTTGVQSIAGAKTFSEEVVFESSTAGFYQRETDAGTNEKRWFIGASGGRYGFYAVSDDFGTFNEFLKFYRSAATPTVAEFDICDLRIEPSRTNTETNSAGYLGAPVVDGNSAYAFPREDSGKTIYHNEAGTRTWTIPANASVAHPIGTVFILDNTGNSGAAGAITLAITSDTLRRGDGVSGTGSRTVPAGGVACIRKVTSTEWIITGIFT